MEVEYNKAIKWMCIDGKYIEERISRKKQHREYLNMKK